MWAIRNHSVHSANLLESAKSVTQTTLLVAYQMHERCDGSGYPCGRRDTYIHPLAKIAGAADSIVAAGGWRPHRPALSLYESMVKVALMETKRGRFDPDFIRALLDYMSLFPIGS